MGKRAFIAILTMGFSGLIAEILLLREFLIVFSGNEFSIGIILANWLILEACGSFFLGRATEKSPNKLRKFTLISFLFSLSLLISIFIIRVLKRLIGVSIGENVGILTIFLSSFPILFPTSVLHGALFPLSCQIYSMFSGQNPSAAGRVYAYETVGTVVGGIICTYLLIPYLDTFQAASGLTTLNALVCLILLFPNLKTGPDQKTILAILIAFIFFALVLVSQADKLHYYSIKAQWKNQNVVHYQNSPYGNICVIENEGQYIFFQDGVPSVITPIPDMASVEEFVHLPLLAHPEPQELLILSGGAGGVISEALKHPSIQTIEYAELDPLLIALFRKFPTPLTESELNDRRVQIKHVDGRLLLKTTQHKYDVILVGITEPTTLQTNRFFTKEFFALANERLKKGGILVIGLPGSLTYSNEELKNLNSSIFHTLESVFPYIRIIPGDGTNLFLASDSEGIVALDRAKIIERLNQRKIKTEVIIPWYIEQKLHQGWQTWFSHFIKGGSQKTNSDFQPIGVFYSISHWNSLFSPSFGQVFRKFEKIDLSLFVLFIILFFIIYFFFRLRDRRLFQAGIPISIATTGFAGMIFDLMLIFAFQSIYGYVFSWIGILVAFFMAGAACGAMLIVSVLERVKSKFFIGIELALVCFSIGCPFILFAANAYLGDPNMFLLFRLLFLMISFISGLLIGSQFPLANKMHLKGSAGLSKTAGLLYASDLLGGWFAGIIGSVFLLPVLGLLGTCIVVALLKLSSFIVMSTQAHQYS